MKIIFIAWKNCWQKAGATTLTLLLLSFGVGIISMMLLLENQLSEKFNKNIKDIDFVLGAKGSPLQLILANVYHIDAPTGNIKVSEAQRIIKNPTVKEAIPLAYGDNYEGWRIVGTTPRYAEFYEVKLREGKVFETPFEVTVGSYAAKELGLKLGQTFKSNHGLDKDGEEEEGHDQLFTVVGIYEASGTVIDRLILTPVESIWEVHDHGDHEESPHNAIVSAEEHDAEEHEDGHDAEHTAEEGHADHEDEHMHEEEVLHEMLKMALNCFPEVERILLLLPVNVPLFKPLLGNFEPIQLRPDTDAETVNVQVFHATRTDIIGELVVRAAMVEDHDDLTPIFKAQKEGAEEYGEFFLAQMIQSQDANNKALVAELNGRAVCVDSLCLV